ncbi:MAG: bifunctional riboflavin kinase/FAD synthetase [Acidobacteriota bacterium]|nr:bifunctional riboflavin kinase/FAD synthetase [Acidobacteriota bacterium]MDH3785784.1 bifunctional riboflavin kinase/FAD synthetase [Acidobacteriota bacterium]
MNIWNGLQELPEDDGRFVATIGNYDGVHLGHQAILKRIVERARQKDLRSLLITFDPHPLSVVAPERQPSLIQTRGQKLDSLRATGISDLCIIPFDRGIAVQDGRSFFRETLAPNLQFSEIHVGDNFRFGRGRKGDVPLLRELGESFEFEVHDVDPIVVDDLPVSSSRIREAIANGDVDKAARMLGRPFELVGEIVRGEGRGRKLDCPTANLMTSGSLLPATGVYITECLVTATRYGGMTNVGTRPTFDDGAISVETHLLGYDGELYGQEMTVRFLTHLREEARFDGPESLADQLARDRAASLAYFENAAFPIG